MNDVKKKFSISLDIKTKDAEEQLKGTAENIKKILKNVAQESKNFKYFSDLDNQLAKIDQRMSDLSTKYKGVLDNTLSGIGSSMQEGIGQVIKNANDGLVDIQNNLSVIQGKVDGWKSTSAEFSEIVKVANSALKGGKITGFSGTKEEIKELYSSFDKLVEAKKAFEDSGDTSSEEYIKNYIKLMKSASGIIYADDKSASGKSFGINVEALSEKAEKAKAVLSSMLSGDLSSKTSAININKHIDDYMNSAVQHMEDAAIDAAQKMGEAMKSVFAEVANAMNGNIPDIVGDPEEIMEEADKSVQAINAAKVKIVEAWEEYHKAAEEAKNKGYKVEDGSITEEMEDMKTSISNLLKELGAKTTKGKYKNADWALDLSGDIEVGDIGLDEISAEVDKIFEESGIIVEATFEEISASSKEASAEISSSLESVEIKTNDISSAFKKLIEYINKYGDTPKSFFSGLVSGAIQLDEELKYILEYLNLIDKSGNAKFKIPSGGFSNSGGMISDEYALISREKSKLKHSLAAKEKTAQAKALGANIGAVLEIYETQDAIFELQNTVKGKGILDFKKGIVNLDFLSATEEQIEKLIKDLLILQQAGLYVDWNGNNILYDEAEGFSFIDFFSGSVEPYTVGPDNSIKDNLDMFLSKIKEINPSYHNMLNGGEFYSTLYDMADKVTLTTNALETSVAAKAESQSGSGAFASTIDKEEDAHVQNTEAINAENDAIAKQIELKKKAQSMTWEEFALDESLQDLKKSSGIQTLGDAESYWKSANYEKQIDFYELQDDAKVKAKDEAWQAYGNAILAGAPQYELDALSNAYAKAKKEAEDAAKNIVKDIISSSIDYEVRSGWYSGQDFEDKNKIENAILANDKLRNAALNKLWHIYKEYIDSSIEFDDFLNSEFSVYRGDKAPVVYGQDQKLSFSFDEQTALEFAGHDKNYVKETKIIPKQTLGSVATSSYEDEMEVFVPNELTPYIQNNPNSFIEYYKGLSYEMQKEVNGRLMLLEKQRVKNLLGKELAYNTKIASSKDYFKNLTENSFSKGIVPSEIDSSEYFGIGNDDFGDTYNTLSDFQKRLVAYYSTLLSMTENFDKQFASSEVGKTGLFSAVMNDPSGMKKHIASLTNEAAFGFFGDNSQDLEKEVELHKQATQAIQEEAKAQQVLNASKESSGKVESTFTNAMQELNTNYMQTLNASEEDDLLKLQTEISDVEATLKTLNESHLIDGGEYVEQTTGIVSSFENLWNNITEFEDTYGKSLELVKKYLEQTFSNYISKDLEESFEDLVLDDELLLEDFDLDDGSKKPDTSSIHAQFDLESYEAKAAIDELADFYKYYQELQSKINTDPISIPFSNYPSQDEKDAVLATFGEINKKIKEINNMPVIETEDDAKKLQMLKAEVEGLINKLKEAKIYGADADTYMETYGMSSFDDASLMHDLLAYGSPYHVKEDSYNQYKSMLESVYWGDTSGDFATFMTETDSFEAFLLERAQAMQEQKAASELQLQTEQQITAEKQKQASVEDGQAVDIKQEESALNDLLIKLQQVEKAIKDKTDAFIDEGYSLESVVKNEISYLSNLNESLIEIKNTINDINGLSLNYDIDPSKIKENLNGVELKPSVNNALGDYALENTLLNTNSILDQILAALSGDKSTINLAASINDAVKELKNVANGIVQHQKAQKTDTSVANARIANTSTHDQIRDVALNAVSGRVIDGGDSQVINMTALANGIVKVTGYVQTAEDAWEGFTLQVNEANEVSKIAFDINAKAAKDAARAAEILKSASTSKPDIYSKEETELRAKVHLDEYTAQGKNATVQFKDSGRYTITILEEIDGLSKQIFQTFDENEEMIERTTATISNAQKVKLDNLKSIIGSGIDDKIISDDDVQYKQYKLAADQLEEMNKLYRDNDSITNDDLLKWNEQIKLVDQLGVSVEKLINKRKVSADNEVFKSDVLKKSAGFNFDKAKLEETINIPESFVQRINDAGDAIRNATDSDSLKIAVNNWQALKKEIEATAIQQDLYIKKQKTVVSTTKKGSFGATAEINAIGKYNSLKELANSDKFANSDVVKRAFAKYEESYNKFLAERKRLADLPNVTKDEEAAFKALTKECNNYATALSKIINNSNKLRSQDIDGNPYELGSDFKDDRTGRKAALKDFVSQLDSVDAATVKFDDNFTKCMYTVDNGDGTFTRMTATFDDARTSIVQLAGETGKITGKLESLWNMFKGKLASIGTYLLASFSFREVWQQIKKGVQYVKEIDSALTELKKVTDETDASYKQFLQDMSKSGSVIGATISDLTTMAADWARLGYSMEEAGKLAESTAILLNVSEFEDATKASEALISTMQAFSYTADESQHVVDILNEVGNNFAVSSDGIATALQDSASALMEAGNNLEQSVALVAAANKVVQDPDSVGSALRTISLRLRGTTVSVLEEMGEETDGVVESVSKMQKKIEALTGVNILTDSGAYKETYQILYEIGHVWEEMSDVDQAALLELMAGKNRANTLAAILGNMEDLEDAYKMAMDAEGSALRENETYLNSIQGRIDLFTNAVQTMWMNLIDSSFVKSIVDLGTLLIKFLDSGAGRVTALSAALLVLNKTLKISPVFKSVNGQLQIFGKTLNTIKNDFAQLSEQSTGSFGKIKAGFSAIFGDSVDGKIDLSGMLSEGDFNEKLKGLLTGFDELKGTVKEIPWEDYVNGISKSDAAMGAALKTCEKQNGVMVAGAGAYKAYTGAAAGAAVGNKAVESSSKKTTAALIGTKVAALAANAALTMGISFLISLAVKGITAWANAEKEAAEAARNAAEASKELREQSKSLKEYKEQIEDLRSKLDANTLSESEAYDAREKLLSIQDELIEKFGLEKDGINLVTGAIEKQIAAIDKLSQDSANQWLNTNQKSINKAIEFFDSETKGGLLDSFWEGQNTTITNWGTTKNVASMIEEYANNPDRDNIGVVTINGIGQDITFSGSVEDVKSEVEDFISWIGERQGDVQKELSSLTSIPESEQTDDVKDKITSLKNDLAQIQDVYEKIGKEYTNWFGEDSVYAANKAIIEETQYNTALTKYSDQYMKILQAQNDLVEAQITGDQDGITQALEVINSETAAAAADAETNGQSYMVNFFNGIRDEYALQLKEMNLKEGLTGDLKKTVESALFGLNGKNAKEILQLKDIEFVGDFEQYQSSWDSLNDIAQSYDMTIDELINSLVNLGYVQSDFAESVEKTAEGVNSYNSIVESIENYNNAIKQTSEITFDNVKVTEEYKESLKDLGISERDLNECFYENNKFVVKDAKALNKLVESTKNNIAKNTQLAKSQAKLQYYELYKEMSNYINAEGVITKGTEEQIISLYNEMEALEKTIAQYSRLETKLLGAANAYNEFELAQNSDAETDYISSVEEMVVSLGEAFNTAELGSETAQASIAGLVPQSVYEDLDTVDEKMSAIYDYFKNGKMSQYFTLSFDDDGNIESAEMKLGNLRKFIEDGLDSAKVFEGSDWQHFEFSQSFLEGLEDAGDKLQYFADRMGVTKEVAFAFIESINDHDIEWLNGDYSSLFDSLTPESLENKFYNTMQAIADLNIQLVNNKISAEDYSKSLHELTKQEEGLAEKARTDAASWYEKTDKLSEYNKQLEEYYKQLESGKDAEGNIIDADAINKEVENVTENINNLAEELSVLDEPTELTLQIAWDAIQEDMDAIENEIGDVIEGTHYKFNVESAKYEVILDESDSNYQKIVQFVDYLNEQHVIDTKMGGETPDVVSTLKDINDVLTNIQKLLETKYNLQINTDGAVSQTQIFKDLWDGITDKTVTLWSTVKENVIQYFTKKGNVNGTANINGSAYASGSWGLPTNESDSLVGELGPELVVDPSSGRYYTVGDNGAEMVDLPKGAIIFNHKQTEGLLKNGYVTSRGKAYAEGNAHVTLWPNASSNSQWAGTGYSGPNDPTYDLQEALGNAADSVGEFEETMDWIAIRMEEFDECIGKLSAELENLTTSTEKNAKIDELITQNQKKYADALAGAKYYQDYAEKYLQGMDSTLVEAAKNGAIAITEFTKEQDEATVEAIQNYRDYAQKAADLQQQAEEAITEITSLAKQAIDNIAQEYENKRSLKDNKVDQYDAYNGYLETDTGFESISVYQSMIEETNKVISDLEEQRNKMQEELNKRVESGEIAVGSQEWYDAVNDIAALDTEIIELKTDTENYQDAINEIHWDQFDLLKDKFGLISDEINNLIDLLGNSDLVDESGNWTDEGMASLGLYAQQMEAAEAQAKSYEEQINYLNENWQALGYTEEEYLDKLSELKDGQYDSIQAYYDAQEAIVNLNKTRVDAIKKGIEKEIEAYEELIKKKKEALDADKSLYDFQKSTMEKEKNIAEIRRKIAALEGDKSASAIAKRKQLEAELAEANADLQDSYYNRSVENQQGALDKELDNFKDEKEEEIEKLEKWLEDVEAVVSESLGIVKANAEEIGNTLTSKAEEYNLTVSDAILSPWEDGSMAISDYQNTFDTAMSSTTDQLNALKDDWQEVIDKVEEYGQKYTDVVNQNNDNYTSATYTPPETPSEPAPSNTPSTESKPSLTKGSYVEVKPGTRWYADSYGGGASGTARSGTIQYINTSGSHAYNIEGLGWIKKSDIKGYAKGTSSLKKNGIVNVDELGEELILRAKNGRLTYMEKGSGVIPSDLTSNLMEWGKLDPTSMLDQNRPSVGVHPEINHTEISIDNSIGELIHIDNCSTETLPDVKKIVNEALEKHTQKLNQSLRKYTR